MFNKDSITPFGYVIGLTAKFNKEAVKNIVTLDDDRNPLPPIMQDIYIEHGVYVPPMYSPSAKVGEEEKLYDYWQWVLDNIRPPAREIVCGTDGSEYRPVGFNNLRFQKGDRVRLLEPQIIERNGYTLHGYSRRYVNPVPGIVGTITEVHNWHNEVSEPNSRKPLQEIQDYSVKWDFNNGGFYWHWDEELEPAETDSATEIVCAAQPDSSIYPLHTFSLGDRVVYNEEEFVRRKGDILRYKEDIDKRTVFIVEKYRDDVGYKIVQIHKYGDSFSFAIAESYLKPEMEGQSEIVYSSEKWQPVSSMSEVAVGDTVRWRSKSSDNRKWMYKYIAEIQIENDKTHPPLLWGPGSTVILEDIDMSASRASWTSIGRAGNRSGKDWFSSFDIEMILPEVETQSEIV